FPKKASSFNMKKNKFKKKGREASYGGTVLQRKPARYFTADLSEDAEGISHSKNKGKFPNGKMNKNSKMKGGGLQSGKKSRGKAVKGTCIEHQMLGGSDDEMYASDGDIVDVSDMIEDVKKDEEEEECATVSMANTLNTWRHTVEESDIKQENVGVTSISKKRPSKNKKLNPKQNFADSDGGEEKVVEWSTGRGSSRLAQSDSSGDEEKPEQEDSESDFEEELHKYDESSSHHVDNVSIPSEMGEKDDEEEEQEEVAAFRAEMADLPLAKVREIKEKLGLKLFNKAYFGTEANDDTKEQLKKRAKDEEKEERRGQHRPKEISSKKPVSVFRPLYQDMKGKKRRDPRFDSRAGMFKERCFEDNYSFLNDLRRQEREELVKQAADCDEQGDTEMAEKIREAIRRMDNRERTKAERKLKEETFKELRQENIERMMRGERPVFKTKAKVRLMQMEKKFAQLKRDNKLDNYMKRKAKKEARKEAKRKPDFEHKYGYQE
ncbi:hypothetical protein V3C99_016806, partial [Haemonchus contortus]